MSNDLVRKIEDIERKLEAKKIEEAKLQERIKALEEEKEVICTKMEEANVKDLNELSEKIVSLEKELNNSIESYEKLVN